MWSNAIAGHILVNVEEAHSAGDRGAALRGSATLAENVEILSVTVPS